MWGIVFVYMCVGKYIQEICFLSHSYDTGEGMWKEMDSNFISLFRYVTIRNIITHQYVYEYMPHRASYFNLTT